MRLVLGLLLSLATCFPAAASPADPAPAPSVFAALVDSIAAAPPGKTRTRLVYQLSEGMEFRGNLAPASAAEADRMARVVSQVMLSDPDPVTSWAAGRVLAKYPHPAATSALLEFLGREEPREFLARSSAMEALVSLHEPRAFPYLLKELEGMPNNQMGEAAIQLMAQLGDPRGLAPLHHLATNPHLEDSCASSPRSRGVADPARYCADQAARIRSQASRAERDLRRFLADRTFSPFDLSDSTWAQLRRNGFAVGAETRNEMYEFLDPAYPCVTTDLCLHAFHLVAKAALGELDSLVIAPKLASFCGQMRDACLETSRKSRDSATRGAAAHDVLYFAVAQALLEGNNQGLDGLPVMSKGIVQAELLQIRAHTSAGPSLMPDGTEDFTKYTPRDRFSGDPSSEGYFQAIVWLGRILEPVKKDESLRRALVMAGELRRRPALAAHWQEIDRLLRSLYGPPDDIRLGDLARVLDQLEIPASADAPMNAATLARIRGALARFSPPRIRTRVPTATDARADLAVSVLGQRYTRSVHLIQLQLDSGIWPPTGVTIPAVLLGSARAQALLPPKAKQASQRWGALVPEPGPAGPWDLPEASLDASATLFRTPDKAPAFMKRAAWEEKEINTALGAWVEMVNLTSPFTKDANVYMSASPMMDRFHGWVEPLPNFYARLDSMVVTLANRLAGAGMFDAVVASRDRVMATFPPEKDPAHRTESDWRNNLARDEAKIRVTRDLFDELSEILKRCQAISRRELGGEGQTIGDGVFLKSLRERFKRLAFNRSNSVEAREPMGVVADPATEYQSHQCWEVATGKPHALYVAVPDGDRTFVCLGAVYSYHEFTRPMNQRLDDTNWRAMLKQRDADLPPAWGDSRPALRPTEPVRASMYGAR